MSNIQPYRRDRLRRSLTQAIAERQELAKQNTEILYPQRVQPSGNLSQIRQQSFVPAPTVASSSSIENRFGLAVVIFAIGASVALVLLSVGGMVGSIAQSLKEPAPNVWVRNEQIRQ